ncbi:redox-sensitive transcriptional activator SoxR [Terasakiispira papahanaumokuakeensis]|uniref:Redox-sensitive transcriptional activator SoxR n=1 Tax=Terasakiispira papahanaumokuakeensis TaxID=197479 RepID=A0A1E2VAS6_9GAMM|nr:redox-sensitive transcriptional activator SoxR [Terasakiispira papahanaumokuakeensis]
MVAFSKLSPKKQVLKVGDVARRSAISVATVHFYEQKGLIKSWRDAGNQRCFSRDVLRRIAMIRIAQNTGLSLNEIKQALAHFPVEKKLTSADWRSLSRHWREVLNKRIASLKALRDQMDDCIGCGCLSLQQCPLRNADDWQADAEI